MDIFGFLEDEQCRERIDSVPLDQFVVLVNVYLDDLYGVHFASQFVQDWSLQLAGAAPIRVEVDEYGNIRFQNLILKVGGCDVNDFR